MEKLNDARRKIEMKYTEKIINITRTIGKYDKCIKGFIVEVTHPIAGYILSNEIVTRTIAEIPSIYLKENLLRYLMERLTDSDVFKILFYVIIDSQYLLSKKFEDMITKEKPEPYVHKVYYPDSSNHGYTLSLERISKEIIDQNIVSSNIVNISCIESLRMLSYIIAKEVL